MSTGSGAAIRSGAPDTGCANASDSAWSAWRGKAARPPPRPAGVRRHGPAACLHRPCRPRPDARAPPVHPQLVRPPGLGRQPEQRRAGKRSTTSQRVTARPSAARRHAHALALPRMRPIGRSMRPRPAPAPPRGRSPRSASIVRSRNCRASPSSAAAVRATSSTPEVSRSRRWTMPGRSARADAARARPAGRATRSRPSRAARRAPDAPPCRAACRWRAGARPRRGPRAAGPPASIVAGSAAARRASTTRAPGAQRVRAFRATPSTATRPASTSALRLRARADARRSVGEEAVEPLAGRRRRDA